MNNRRKQLLINLAAFLLLFFVSLYRQVSLRRFPSDPYRTYILYAGYLILAGLWAVSIILRVTQRSMKVFLLCEDAIMLFGLTVRFVQDTFLANQIPVLRITGLLISTTLLPIMLLGLYASLCIGMGNDYRIPCRWYWLLLPMTALFPLILTDNIHHIFTYIIPTEPQPNLTFHLNTGFFLVFALILGLAVIRVLIIYRRNSRMDRHPLLKRVIPLMEGILLFVLFLPYILNWMQTDAPTAPPEVIEQYAKLYYVEVLTWEIYIFLGLVPVNTDYREIFEESTLGLQILPRDGEPIRSHLAERLTPALVERLRKEGKAELAGKELWMHELKQADVVWTKDVSELQATIDELNQSAERLAQEGILIREELKTESEKARLAAQNEIYDTLIREVQGPLHLIQGICREAGAGPKEQNAIRKLFFLGTYVKRRCNLRLIDWESGRIENDDLALSLQEMAAAAESLGISCRLRWDTESELSSSFSLSILDRLEQILEAVGFQAEQMEIRIAKEKASFTVSGIGSGIRPPADAVLNGTEYSWTVTMREKVL